MRARCDELKAARIWGLMRPSRSAFRQMQRSGAGCAATRHCGLCVLKAPTAMHNMTRPRPSRRALPPLPEWVRAPTRVSAHVTPSALTLILSRKSTPHFTMPLHTPPPGPPSTSVSSASGNGLSCSSSSSGPGAGAGPLARPEHTRREHAPHLADTVASTADPLASAASASRRSKNAWYESTTTTGPTSSAASAAWTKPSSLSIASLVLSALVSDAAGTTLSPATMLALGKVGVGWGRGGGGGGKRLREHRHLKRSRVCAWCTPTSLKGRHSKWTTSETAQIRTPNSALD